MIKDQSIAAWKRVATSPVLPSLRKLNIFLDLNCVSKMNNKPESRSGCRVLFKNVGQKIWDRNLGQTNKQIYKVVYDPLLHHNANLLFDHMIEKLSQQHQSYHIFEVLKLCSKKVLFFFNSMVLPSRNCHRPSQGWDWHGNGLAQDKP